MSQELGKIEKPEASSYKGKRKIYLIPLIYGGDESDKHFSKIFNEYWKQVAEHLKNLELKAGMVKHIYHESISESGEAGLKTIEKLSAKTYEIVKGKFENKAILEAMEDKDLFEENIDWQRCLLIGLISEKVANKISDNFLECSKKRYEYISKKINDTLGENESAVLIINERHMIQFADDIEVFRISPPALNDIYKWARKKSSTSGSEESPNSKEESKTD
jgi:hypothetical protein